MEARFSRPFFPEAPSGRTLGDWLNKAGWQRTATLITNLTWCWPAKSTKNGVSSGSRPPTKAEIEFCTKRHLLPLLEKADLLQPSNRVILTLGAESSKFLRENFSDKQIGTFEQRDLRGKVAGDDGGLQDATE